MSMPRLPALRLTLPGLPAPICTRGKRCCTPWTRLRAVWCWCWEVTLGGVASSYCVYWATATEHVFLSDYIYYTGRNKTKKIHNCSFTRIIVKTTTQPQNNITQLKFRLTRLLVCTTTTPRRNSTL